ncbi:TetR family transcriptional regulator [Marmoricola endophyticus]|uniref:TetR family transcriptional regulator n=1 Tax=Marmoricola endophyticus TaxID=2040280 RepID=A0A917F3Q1_9ACTN|nr:TetR/AcrR family transcriptional regulator C-terminal domain-containing protein [Marmoricola endophyticus]GGF45654.1 TetR family transcriptional regulator [Marmoricola endophyticus]
MPRSSAGPRRRASHSLETVLDGAVALLDEAGEQALTFRALAARLGGGVGSIYWYVTGKDELLERAADHVLAPLLHAVEEQPSTADPLADIRASALMLFATVEQRQWLAGYFLRNTTVQPHALRLYELVGEHVMRLELTPRQSFHAVSAVFGFVIGTAADLGQRPSQEMLDGAVDRDSYLERTAEAWRALDRADYPFLHHVSGEFVGHDDADQFEAGLDLILAGLRQQAGRS